MRLFLSLLVLLIFGRSPSVCTLAPETYFHSNQAKEWNGSTPEKLGAFIAGPISSDMSTSQPQILDAKSKRSSAEKLLNISMKILIIGGALMIALLLTFLLTVVSFQGFVLTGVITPGAIGFFIIIFILISSGEAWLILEVMHEDSRPLTPIIELGPFEKPVPRNLSKRFFKPKGPVKSHKVVSFEDSSLMPIDLPSHRFLQQSMAYLVRRHDSNHNLECGYDVVLQWMYWRGIGRKTSTGFDPLTFEDIRRIMAHDFKQRATLANVFWTIAGIENFFDFFSEHHPEKRPLTWESFSIETDATWSIFLQAMKEQVQRDGLVLLADCEGAYNIYGVDLQTQELLVVDPHWRQKNILQRRKRQDFISEQTLKVFSYPSRTEEFFVKAIKGHLKKEKAKKWGLYEEVWGNIYVFANQVHQDMFGEQYKLFLKNNNSRYVHGINVRFYDQVDQLADQSHLSYYEQKLKNKLQLFREGLNKLSSEFQYSDGQLLHHILESMPCCYKKMMKHYSWHVLGLDRAEGDQGKKNPEHVLTALLQEYPALEGVRAKVVFKSGLETPAQYRNGAIELHPSFWDHDLSLGEKMFNLSILVHELLRATEFQALVPFVEIVMNSSSEKMEAEKKLIKRELEWLYNLIGKQGFKSFREEILTMYDVGRLQKNVPGRGNLAWEDILSAFEDVKENRVAENFLDEEIVTYLNIAIYA